jgi:hypothetical protein
MRRVVLKVVRKAYRSLLLGLIVAGINIASIRPKVVIREGVYTRGGLFILRREGFMRGA